MKPKRILVLFVLLYNGLLFAQQSPTLVIGIVVDQMTNEYLYRFNHTFGTGGFNRLINQGYYYPNTFYNYRSTSTGPGHASIYTGTNPRLHGIAENMWFDERTQKAVYCVDGLKGKSPEHLIGSSITDMLKLSTQGNSKVFGVGLKDRSAILPAGHSANAAYWWNDESGEWESSAYYMEELPDYMKAFSKEHPVKDYLIEWNIEIDEQDLTFYKDHNAFESALGTEEENDVYDLKIISKKKGLSVLKTSPFGNTYTFDFSKMLIENEQLGSDLATDFLCVSFSSTDYIGHSFGPYSAEVMDTYRRFDLDLANFINFLDEKVGPSNYLLFLTSDHGVVPNIEFLQGEKIKAQRLDETALGDALSNHLLLNYKTDSLVRGVADGQVYLNHANIEKGKLKKAELLRTVCDFLNEQEIVLSALSSHDLTYKEYREFPESAMQQSYYKKRSGDVLFVTEPFTRSSEYIKGTGHGTPYVYDRNVPLIWYGSQIKKGFSYQNVDIGQIAATLADLLQIQRPPSCTAESLTDNISK